MAQTDLLFPNGRLRALTLSYDDGVETDIRMMEILDRYGIKCTFNLNSGLYAPEGTAYPAGTIHRRMSRSQIDAAYHAPHEISTHALTHPFIDRMPDARIAYEIVKDRENLEAQFGCIVRGHAYPYGVFDDRVVQILKDSGIAYARTVISSHRFDLPRDWLRLEATCHHNDPALSELMEKFLADDPRPKAKFFYIWGHSYEFDQYDNWELLENIAQTLGRRKDVWYCTNMEAYTYIEAYRRLIFSVDGTRVHNPSAQEIYFCHEGKVFHIMPEETLSLS